MAGLGAHSWPALSFHPSPNLAAILESHNWCDVQHPPAHCRAGLRPPGLGSSPHLPALLLSPFDKDDQPSAASSVNKASTVNKRFSTYNQSPPDTPSLREQAFYVSSGPRGAACGWGEVALGGICFVESSLPGEVPMGGTAWGQGRADLPRSSAPSVPPRPPAPALQPSQLLFSLPKSPARAADKHGWSLLDIFRETLLEKLSRSCSCGDVSSVELRRWPRPGRVSARAGAGL